MLSGNIDTVQKAKAVHKGFIAPPPGHFTHVLSYM
jgi:hypothetical protein